MAEATLSILIKAKNDASSVFKDVEKDASSLGSKMGTALKAGGLLAAGGIAAAGVAAVKFVGAASDLNESLSKVRIVFGENSKEIEDWAKTASSAMGQSRQQALEAAGTFGNLFDALGLAAPQATDMSKSIVELATDLASFNNISVDEALIKLRSGLVGEAEPLRSLGVNINEATVSAKAMELGMVKVNGAFTDAQKVQARYALIMDQTTNAQGDFARTSDGLANQQKILSAQWKDIQATIGNALLPTLAALATVLTGFFAAHQADIDQFAQMMAVKIPAGIDAVQRGFEEIRPTLDQVFTQMKEGFEVIKPGIQWILDHKIAMVATFTAIGVAALLAFSPVTVPILAISAALVALSVVLGMNKEDWKEFGAAFNKVWEDIQQTIKDKLGIIGLVIVFYMDIIRNQVETTFKVIRDIVVIVMALIQGDWGAAWAGIKQLGSDFIDGILADLRLKLGLVRDIFGGAMIGAYAAILAVWDQIRGFFAELPFAITSAIGDLYGVLYQFAKNAVQGFINGILDIGGDILSAIKSKLVDEPVSLVRKGWELFSPSRVTYDMGVNIVQGMTNGINDTAGSLFTSIDNIVAQAAARIAAVKQQVANATSGDSGGDVNSDYGQREVGNEQRAQRVGGRTRDEWKYIFGASGIPASEYNSKLKEMFGYERGTNYVPQTGPAWLHKGEAVIPASENRGNVGATTVINNYIDKVIIEGDPQAGLASLGVASLGI